MSEEKDNRVHWNDPALLEAAGTSPESIQALLKRWNQPVPTAHAIYQWSSRRKITAPWRAPLLFALLSERKIGLDRVFRRGAAARKLT